MLIAAKASIRRIILPLLLLSAAIPRAGLAQPAAAPPTGATPAAAPPTGATPAPAAQAPKPAPAAALNAAQAKDALDALQDPKKRAQLISVLDAIAKTGIVPAPPPAPAPPPPPAAAEPSLAIPLAPDSLGAQLLVGVPDRLAQLSEQLTQTFDAATDFPLLWLWLYQLTSDPTVHQLLYDVGWRLAVVMGVALIAEFLLRRALRRPIAALANRAPALPPPPAAHPTAGLAAAEAGAIEAPDLPPPTAHRPPTFRPSQGHELRVETLEGAHVTIAVRGGGNRAGRGRWTSPPARIRR